mmetsp:Transcript_18522/g.58292  ORF Transcript_18522/g.58292 Transcript_18522/m.58292 type:complete len:268 (-) Transcript_18522:74-877(-)
MMLLRLLAVAAVGDGLRASEVGAALGRRGQKPSVSVRFEPPPPTAGLEFLHGVMVLTASASLREAGAAMMICGDLETLRTVADEQAAAEDARPMILAVEADAEAALEAGATAVIVRDAAALAAARAVGLAPIASSPLAGAAAVLSADAVDAEGVVLRDISTEDDPPDGVDGVVLRPAAACASPAEIADALRPRVLDLKSAKSKAFAGFLSGSSTQLDYTDDQRNAVAWGNFVQNAQRAGLVDTEDLSDDDPAATADLDTERGDYKGF